MDTAKGLREHCDKLRAEREEALKSVLIDYFEKTFLKNHRPWRAVIGNKKCKPIPIHRTFCFYDQDSFGCFKFKWPNLSESMIRKGLVDLGFVVTEHQISISVSPHTKGEPLSFAQEWVKKINHSYSEYCHDQKQIAKDLYVELISKLSSAPSEIIKTYDTFTLFCDFKLDTSMSSQCATYMRRLMSRDGIEEFYENGVYKGIKILKQPSN